MDPYKAGAALGDALLGSSDERTYYDQLKRVYNADEAMSEASIRRSQAIARAALGDATRNMMKSRGFSDADAEYTAVTHGMATGQPILRHATQGLGDLSDMELDRHIQAKMETGDYRGANQLTAVKKDEFYEPVRLVNGNLIPSGVGLGDEGFEMIPLPQTLATIEQKEQLGNAAMVRANKPPSGGGGRGGKPNPEDDVLAQARERIAGGADPASVATYLVRRGYPGVAKRIYTAPKAK